MPTVATVRKVEPSSLSSTVSPLLQGAIERLGADQQPSHGSLLQVLQQAPQLIFPRVSL